MTADRIPRIAESHFRVTATQGTSFVAGDGNNAPDLYRWVTRQVEDAVSGITDIQSMAAYAVQNATGLLKLDAMENPYRLPEKLREEVGRLVAGVAINRYPGRRNADVVAALEASPETAAGSQFVCGCAINATSRALVAWPATVCN